MSIGKPCPYDEDKAECKYEKYWFHPRFDKCPTCDRFLRQNLPDIDTSKFNIDENGCVVKSERSGKELLQNNKPIQGLTESDIPALAERETLRNIIIGKLMEIEDLKKENQSFKQQIERMRNHYNCKWFHEWNLATAANEPFDCMSPCLGCKKYSLWEPQDEKN